MARLRMWVEIFTTHRLEEETIDVPPEWDQMDYLQREAWAADCWHNMLDEIANGGYEIEEESDHGSG